MKITRKKEEDLPYIWLEDRDHVAPPQKLILGPRFEQWLEDSISRPRPDPAPAYTPAPRTGGSDYLSWADSRIRESDPGTALPSRPPQTGGSDYISWAESKLRESNPGTYLPHAGYRPGSGDYLSWADSRIRASNPGKPLPSPGPRSPSGGSVFSEYKSGALLPSQVSGYASVPGTSAAVPIPKPARSRSDDNILKHDLDIYNSWPKEDQDALLWYLDNRIGGRQDFLNIIGGTPLTVEESAWGVGYQALEKRYGADVVAQVAESVDRWRNQDLAAREAAEAASIAQGSGLLGFAIPRGLNIAAIVPKHNGILGSRLLSTGRYSTADPNNWGSRYGAYSQTLDRVNGDLAGQRLTNGLEFLSRMAQGAALPGSVDYTAPLTWYDSTEGTGARKLIDGGGRLLYDAAASAADDTIRRVATMGLAGIPLPGFVSPKVLEKMPQIASSLMAAGNTYADNHAAYSADGTPIAQAKGLAAVDSALEAVSEFLPFDRLLKIPDITPETVSDTVKEVILSSVKEIPEEVASSIGSTLADILIRRDRSDFVRTMDAAKAEGRTGGQAFWYALGQEGLDLLREAAVTFLSGNLSGGATVGAKTLMHSQADPASSLTAPQGTAADPGSSQKAAAPTGQTAPAAPGAQNQTQAPGTNPGSGVSNFWNTYMDAVRSYFFPQNAGTQTGIQTETQTGQNGMQTQIPGAAQPGAQQQVPGRVQDGSESATGTKPAVTPAQRIENLTAAIKKSGLTTGKATIAAQTLYQTAQQYGPNAEAMLAAYEPGQDPKRFASGFQNAYILGTQGNQAALQNSKAAAYLTKQQREFAYKLGRAEANNQIDIQMKNDTMDVNDLQIGKSLGAKAKNYKVMDLSTGEMFSFAEGTSIQNVEVFAGKNSSREYEKAYRYAERHGGAIEDWQHVKGKGWLETPDGDRYAEVHWSQCPGIGKFDFFVKRWLD